MPRWVRFLCCSLTGVLLAVPGLILTAYWQEGRPGFWLALLQFAATSAFWGLLILCLLLVAGGLLAGRGLIRLADLSDPMAGFLTTGSLALGYIAFLTAANASLWGGPSGALQRLWPAGALIALPFALAGSMASWLWGRLE